MVSGTKSLQELTTASNPLIMYSLKILSLLVLVCLALCFANATAQSLNGKIIHVSPSQEVMLKFRSVISDFNFTNKDASSLFQTRITNSKNFSISSTVAGFKSTNLIISEGKNTHLFIIDYKETLDTEENLYNFDKVTLRKEADLLDKMVKKEIDSVHLNKNVIVDAVKNIDNPKPTEKEIQSKYDDIKFKANNLFINRKYDEAKQLYNAALVLIPNDAWSLSQLSAIENKKSISIKDDQQKMSASAYQNFRRLGDSAINKKLYEPAITAYQQALNERPNDPYVAAQLKKIVDAKRNDGYLNYINLGRDAVKNGLLDNAELAFKEALKINPKDPEATRELSKITIAKASFLKKQTEDKSMAALENKYKDTISIARNFFETGMYEESRKKYKKAELMKPGVGLHKTMIATIDSILLKQKSASNKLKQDSLDMAAYANQIEKGINALENKDLKKAKVFFQQAQILKPKDTYAVQKISEIDVLTMQLDEEKKKNTAGKIIIDSVSKRYDFFIRQGTKAAGKNDLALAQASFSKALELKPGEKFPADQLIIINQKLKEINDNERFDLFMHKGDSVAYKAKDPKASLAWYDSAHQLKPDKLIPRNRITTINQLISKNDSNAIEIANRKLRTTKYDAAMDGFTKAESARLQKQYDAAYKGYAEFLTKIDLPDNDKYTAVQQNNINQAKGWITRLAPYKSDPAVDSIRNAHVQDSLNNFKSGKRKKKKS